MTDLQSVNPAIAPQNQQVDQGADSTKSAAVAAEEEALMQGAVEVGFMVLIQGMQSTMSKVHEMANKTT